MMLAAYLPKAWFKTMGQFAKSIWLYKALWSHTTFNCDCSNCHNSCKPSLNHAFILYTQFRVCLKSALHIIVCGEAMHTKRTKIEPEQNKNGTAHVKVSRG